MGLDSAVYVIPAQYRDLRHSDPGKHLGTKTAVVRRSPCCSLTSSAHLSWRSRCGFLPIVDWITGTPGSPVNQIANFHTFFNVVGAFIFIGIPQVLTKLSYFFVRGEDKRFGKARSSNISTRMRTARPSRSARQSSRFHGWNGFPAKTSTLRSGALERDEKLINEVGENERSSITSTMEITDALANVSQTGLSEVDSRTVTGLLHVIMDIERISDIAQNIADIAAIRLDKKD